MASLILSMEFYRRFSGVSLAMRRAALCLLLTVVQGIIALAEMNTKNSRGGYDANISSYENHNSKIKNNRNNWIASSSSGGGVLDSLLHISSGGNGGSGTAVRRTTTDGLQSSSSSSLVKQELLTETPLLSFIERLLEEQEEERELGTGIEGKGEKDPLCQQMILSLLSLFREELS
jgi:hypothetical protein